MSSNMEQEGKYVGRMIQKENTTAAVYLKNMHKRCPNELEKEEEYCDGNIQRR